MSDEHLDHLSDRENRWLFDELKIHLRREIPQRRPSPQDYGLLAVADELEARRAIRITRTRPGPEGDEPGDN